MEYIEKKYRVNGVARIILFPALWVRRKYMYYSRYFLGKFFPRRLASKMYESAMHRKMNWENPQDLNEKITWLKMNSDTTEWTRLADKYRVREYIKEKGYEDILVKLLGVWERVEDMEFDKLPKQFVLKTNNGAGAVLFVKDKAQLNIEETKAKINGWLKEDFGLMNAEPHYSRIKPMIIAEEFLDSGTNVSFSLVDYKMWCFNGKLFGTWVCYDRVGMSAMTEWHDVEWKYRPEWSVFTYKYKDGGGVIPKPVNYDRMVKVAQDLSLGFPQVRVDLYNVNGKIYFGEMTFSASGGHNNFYTDEVAKEMGNMIELPR